MCTATVRVQYLQLTRPPAPIPIHAGDERIAIERPSLESYLALYQEVGAPLRWDQRVNMPQEELRALLASPHLEIYILREASGRALGFCEFDTSALPEVELKNFGLVPTAQGRGLGPWLLATALHAQWKLRPVRIWLHTDAWDHPAAAHVYQRAGFEVYLTREEPSGPL